MHLRDVIKLATFQKVPPPRAALLFALFAGLTINPAFANLSGVTAPAIAIVQAAQSSAPAAAPVLAPSAALSLSEEELRRWCNPVTRVLPTIKLKPCMRAGLQPSGAKSVKGLPILTREIEAREVGIQEVGAREAGAREIRARNGSAAARVLVIGGIHGDELTASSVVFRWLEWIDQVEARAYHWQIVPVLNLDGLLAKPATRVNANGVDLNRNFPTPNWEKEAQKYWTVKTANDPRRFPGKAPISEPESRWLHNEIKRFKPDVIISIHAPFGVLDFDGPVAPPHKLGALILTPVGIYPGSLGNYGGVHKGVPVVTIELPHALDMPNEAELKSIWRDMLAWIETNVAQKKNADLEQVISGVR